jgi:hypothetical protein
MSEAKTWEELEVENKKKKVEILESEISEKLMNIQSKLKAPKGQFNSFGKYKYRSCEDVLESLKPILAEQGCALYINDEITLIGDRHYVKATATIESNNVSISVSAYAREPKERKGMDESQITGATSSYARKYALNGLFCIDDQKDPDSTNEHEKKDPNAGIKYEPGKPGVKTYSERIAAGDKSVPGGVV